MINQEKTYTVLELNRLIKRELESSFPDLVWVSGEVIGFNRNKDKAHIPFQLHEKHSDKDQSISQIPVVIFEGYKKKLREKIVKAKLNFGDGIKIRILGKIYIKPEFGFYQLKIEDIDPSFTLGEMAQNREREGGLV
jgi:exodeoxyribonuclease VII large subunit